MKKELLVVVVATLLAFSFSTHAISARADDLVIQDDGKIVLVITNNGILGVSASSNEPEKTTVPAPQSNPSQQPTEQKQQTSTKAVPLVSPETQSTVQINPPINDDKKVQVTITTKASVQTSQSAGNSQITNNLKSTSTTPPNVITKAVDQVVAQGANGLPVITIKSDKANQLTIQQGTTQVTTLLPLQIDTITHSMSLSSQNESTKVSVLPTEALQGIIDKGFLNTRSASKAKINLTRDTTGANYNIQGENDGKLFGIFSVQSPIQVSLSAQNGTIVKTSQSLLFSIFGKFIK